MGHHDSDTVTSSSTDGSERSSSESVVTKLKGQLYAAELELQVEHGAQECIFLQTMHMPLFCICKSLPTLLVHILFYIFCILFYISCYIFCKSFSILCNEKVVCVTSRTRTQMKMLR